MTKRKTPTQQAPQASTEAVGSVKTKTNTKVATKPKQANTTAKKASTGGRRGRPKKVVDKPTEVEVVSRLIQKAADVESPTITYVDPSVLTKHVVTDWGVVSEPKPSLYDRFVGWLFRITYNFRGY